MAGFRVTNRQIDELARKIRSRVSKIPDPRTVNQIAQIIRRATMDNIRTGKTDADTGAPWTRWSDLTEETRQRQGNADRGILYSSGDLLRSIKTKTSQTAKGRFTRIEVFSEGVDYASYHQNGAGKIPQRKFLGVNPKTSSRIQQTLQKRISQLMADAVR